VALLPLRWHFPHDSLSYKPSPLQAHWGKWNHSCLLWLACLFTVHLKDCPSPTLWGSGCPALFATCLFIYLFFSSCLLFSLFFSPFFSPWVGISLSRGLCCFILGVAEGYRVTLGAHLFGLLKVSQAYLELAAGGSVGGLASVLAGWTMWCGCGGMPVLSVYSGLEKPSMGYRFWVPKFHLSLVLHFHQACLQHLSNVKSCSMCQEQKLNQYLLTSHNPPYVYPLRLGVISSHE
jgi:hypothetical protein